MTVNDQLRRAGEEIRLTSRQAEVPPAPTRARRPVLAPVLTALLALVTVVGVVWLVSGRSAAPVATTPNASGDLAMVEDWVNGALDGRFEEIATLTYGEHGEPEALASLAAEINNRRLQFGEPTVDLFPFAPRGTDLAFTCIDLDFGGFSIDGALVVREWPDQGRKLWEFRNAMEGCTSGPPVTTTFPEMLGLTEVWHHRSSISGYQRLGADFLAFGSKVAVLQGEEADRLEVLDTATGDVAWGMDFPEPKGKLLTANTDRLVWATENLVGVASADGDTLWDHDFDGDGRWPSLAVFDGAGLVVALDPVMEGDERPPALAKFDQSGNVLWTTELQGTYPDENLQWTDLLLADGGVVVQTTGALYRVDLQTGTRDWRSPFAEVAVESFAPTGTFYSDGVVYAADPASEAPGLDGGQVMALDAANGEAHIVLPAARAPRVVGILDRWLVFTDESGVHGQSLDSRDVWTHTDLGALATIDGDRVMTVSPTALAVLGTDGEPEHEVDADGGTPQLPPLVLGERVIVPGWEGTRAIDVATGATINEWPAPFRSPAIAIDSSTALIGVVGDGIYLVRLP